MTLRTKSCEALLLKKDIRNSRTDDRLVSYFTLPVGRCPPSMSDNKLIRVTCSMCNWSIKVIFRSVCSTRGLHQFIEWFCSIIILTTAEVDRQVLRGRMRRRSKNSMMIMMRMMMEKKRTTAQCKKLIFDRFFTSSGQTRGFWSGF